VAEGQLAELLAAAAGRGFDLRHDLPWRAALFVLSPAEHVLLLVLHHIAADAWSMGVLAADLEAAYPGPAAGTSPRVGPAARAVRRLRAVAARRRWAATPTRRA